MMEALGSASFVVITVILVTIVLCTIVGNLFVILAILMDKNLQTTANQLVLSLAVADLMVACLVMPLGAYNDIYQGWYLSKEVCEFWTSADVLCCTASILNLLAIALDRYWAVTNVDYIYRRTKARVNVMILCAWTVGAVVSLAPIFGWKDPDFAWRVLEEHKCMVSQDVAYQIFATISTFYAPLVLLLGLYWRIFQVARKRIRRKPGRAAALALSASRTTRQQLNQPAPSTTNNMLLLQAAGSTPSASESPALPPPPEQNFAAANEASASLKSENIFAHTCRAPCSPAASPRSSRGSAQAQLGAAGPSKAAGRLLNVRLEWRSNNNLISDRQKEARSPARRRNSSRGAGLIGALGAPTASGRRPQSKQDPQTIEAKRLSVKEASNWAEAADKWSRTTTTTTTTSSMQRGAAPGPDAANNGCKNSSRGPLGGGEKGAQKVLWRAHESLAECNGCEEGDQAACRSARRRGSLARWPGARARPASLERPARLSIASGCGALIGSARRKVGGAAPSDDNKNNELPAREGGARLKPSLCSAPSGRQPRALDCGGLRQGASKEQLAAADRCAEAGFVGGARAAGAQLGSSSGACQEGAWRGNKVLGGAREASGQRGEEAHTATSVTMIEKQNYEPAKDGVEIFKRRPAENKQIGTRQQPPWAGRSGHSEPARRPDEDDDCCCCLCDTCARLAASERAPGGPNCAACSAERQIDDRRPMELIGPNRRPLEAAAFLEKSGKSGADLDQVAAHCAEARIDHGRLAPTASAALMHTKRPAAGPKDKSKDKEHFGGRRGAGSGGAQRLAGSSANWGDERAPDARLDMSRWPGEPDKCCQQGEGRPPPPPPPPPTEPGEGLNFEPTTRGGSATPTAGDSPRPGDRRRVAGREAGSDSSLSAAGAPLSLGGAGSNSMMMSSEYLIESADLDQRRGSSEAEWATTEQCDDSQQSGEWPPAECRRLELQLLEQEQDDASLSASFPPPIEARCCRPAPAEGGRADRDRDDERPASSEPSEASCHCGSPDQDRRPEPEDRPASGAQGDRKPVAKAASAAPALAQFGAISERAGSKPRRAPSPAAAATSAASALCRTVSSATSGARRCSFRAHLHLPALLGAGGRAKWASSREIGARQQAAQIIDERGRPTGQHQQQQQQQGFAAKCRPALDLRRKFRAMGQLVSFIQTSRNLNSSSYSSQSGADEYDEPEVGELAAASSCAVPRRPSAPAGGRGRRGSWADAADWSPGARPETSVFTVEGAARPTTSGRGGQSARRGSNSSGSGPAHAPAASGSRSATPLGGEQQVGAAGGRQPSGELASCAQLTAGAANAQNQNKRRAKNMDIRREKKAAKTLAIITGVFVCCWLPFFLNAIIMPICGPSCTPSDLILSVLLWLGYLNSLLNPIIYTIFSPDFRRAFRRLLCWPSLLRFTSAFHKTPPSSTQPATLMKAA